MKYTKLAKVIAGQQIADCNVNRQRWIETPELFGEATSTVVVFEHYRHQFCLGERRRPLHLRVRDVAKLD